MDKGCVFADIECDKCKVLKSPVACEQCSFKKTPDELERGRQRAQCMLDRLSNVRRERIFDKYYKFNK